MLQVALDDSEHVSVVWVLPQDVGRDADGAQRSAEVMPGHTGDASEPLHEFPVLLPAQSLDLLEVGYSVYRRGHVVGQYLQLLPVLLLERVLLGALYVEDPDCLAVDDYRGRELGLRQRVLVIGLPRLGVYREDVVLALLYVVHEDASLLFDGSDRHPFSVERQLHAGGDSPVLGYLH